MSIQIEGYSYSAISYRPEGIYSGMQYIVHFMPRTHGEQERFYITGNQHIVNQIANIHANGYGDLIRVYQYRREFEIDRQVRLRHEASTTSEQ